MKSTSRWMAVLGCLFVLPSLGAAQPPASPVMAQSRVECSTLQSAILARPVPYCVMLPPSYAQERVRRFPVVYYLHGLGDNEQSLANLGGWPIYDRLMREKKVGEFALVAPAGFTSFYVNSRDGQFRYEDFFLHEFLPAMEKKYRIGTSRAQRGIMGISMGGYGAMHYGFKYPEMFAAVSASMPALIEHLPREFSLEWQRKLMGAIFGDPPDLAFYEENSPFYLAHTARLSALKRMTIYFDCGAQDRYGFNTGTLAMDKLLTQRGIPHEVHIDPGGHDWRFALDHFAASLEAQWKGLGSSQEAAKHEAARQEAAR